MVGKTNLTFISKGEGTSAQLIQKSYVTDATETIYKMEIINDRIFAFVNPNNVMTGNNMGELCFVEKDNQYLQATHIIYKNGKYYIVCADQECLIYVTCDFVTYEQIEVGEIIEVEKSVGIFLDSRGRVVLCTKNQTTSSDNKNSDTILIRICNMVEDVKDAEAVYTKLNYGDLTSKAYMCDNKIFMSYRVVDLGALVLRTRILSLNGTYVQSDYQLEPYNYAGGYFFVIKNVNGNNYNVYYLRDGINATLLREMDYYKTGCIVPINGRYCLLGLDGYANIADDILSIGASENIKMKIVDTIRISSVLEYDGKTYIGTGNGIIYEMELDYEGTMQRPDVTIIKTMAAKQALAESLKYTDTCIATLKKYVDDKIQEQVSIEEGNSTEVEPVGNMN